MNAKESRNKQDKRHSAGGTTPHVALQPSANGGFDEEQGRHAPPLFGQSLSPLHFWQSVDFGPIKYLHTHVSPAGQMFPDGVVQEGGGSLHLPDSLVALPDSSTDAPTPSPTDSPSLSRLDLPHIDESAYLTQELPCPGHVAPVWHDLSAAVVWQMPGLDTSVCIWQQVSVHPASSPYCLQQSALSVHWVEYLQQHPLPSGPGVHVTSLHPVHDEARTPPSSALSSASSAELAAAELTFKGRCFVHATSPRVTPRVTPVEE